MTLTRFRTPDAMRRADELARPHRSGGRFHGSHHQRLRTRGTRQKSEFLTLARVVTAPGPVQFLSRLGEPGP